MIIRAVNFAADDIKLSGQLYLPEDAGVPEYPTVCVCHGIPCDSPGVKPEPGDGGYPALAERICREGFAVMIFRFRGVGDSGGNFDIDGWTRDLKAAVDYLWVLSEVDRFRLTLLGYSGGAAVSVCVAAGDDRVSSVAACACPADFDSLKNSLADYESTVKHFRRIGIIRDKDFPPSDEEWLDGFSKIRPIEFVSRISPRPLLLVHGGKDELVDVSHAHRLYGRAGEPKAISVIDGAGHRLRRDERAVASVIEWLKARLV